MRPTPSPVLLRLAALACLTAGYTDAQEQLPPPADLSRIAVELASRIQGQLVPTGSPASRQQDRAAAESELRNFVDRVCAHDQLTPAHVVELSTALLESNPADCFRVAEAGVRRFPESLHLLDHLGRSRLRHADTTWPSAERLRSLRAARLAFTRAVERKHTSAATYLGLFAVQRELGEPSLSVLDAALAQRDAAEQIENPWLLRAGALLLLGKPEEAIRVLEQNQVPASMQATARILRLRALVLAGDAAPAQAQVPALLAADPSDRATAAAIDALLHLGQRAEALAVMRQRPVRAAEQESPEAVERRQQAFSAFSALARNPEWSTSTRIVPALANALRFKFVATDWAGREEDGFEAPLDLSTSPPVLAALLPLSRRPGQESLWARHILLALSLRAGSRHEPTAAEASFLRTFTHEAQAPQADLPAILLALRVAIADPDALGALAAHRVASELARPAAGSAKH